MKARLLLPLLGLGALAAWLPAADPEPATPAHLAGTVSYERMAEALHAVLAATHNVHLRALTDPLGNLDTAGLAFLGQPPVRQPSHAEFLRRAARQIATRGAEFSFALRSSWPISPQGDAQTGAEVAALEQFQQNPDRPVFTDETLGGRAYFTAIYPERASAASCVACHNAHPASPRRDFQPGDLMGALVIRIPREF